MEALVAQEPTLVAVAAHRIAQRSGRAAWDTAVEARFAARIEALKVRATPVNIRKLTALRTRIAGAKATWNPETGPMTLGVAVCSELLTHAADSASDERRWERVAAFQLAHQEDVGWMNLPPQLTPWKARGPARGRSFILEQVQGAKKLGACAKMIATAAATLTARSPEQKAQELIRACHGLARLAVTLRLLILDARKPGSALPGAAWSLALQESKFLAANVEAEWPVRAGTRAVVADRDALIPALRKALRRIEMSGGRAGAADPHPVLASAAELIEVAVLDVPGAVPIVLPLIRVPTTPEGASAMPVPKGDWRPAAWFAEAVRRFGNGARFNREELRRQAAQPQSGLQSQPGKSTGRSLRYYEVASVCGCIAFQSYEGHFRQALAANMSPPRRASPKS
ncbi:hypothetical protein BH11PLA1_BH11PLA1_18500 [soil metagenome]